jgi:hypothetical protein
MNKNKFKHKAKPGDYCIECSECGMPCWASQSRELSKETGKGGQIVCPNCVFAVDPGLIPYKVPAEKSPKIVQKQTEDTTSTRNIVDSSTFDPLSGGFPS